ncbi:hypothetical protein ANN_08053 [Periplaneta americana]|uniref:MADF domain-containing protein n=1 Tax=Periplaneta americana TaxID=6978 RepID=A0ABQ8T1Q8_PERAM|nr:hypothetical protein ANN_08053 [Periplaneta americana]
MEQVLFDEILILSVEENPHVYDKRRASYEDEKMKENTWLSIAVSLNTDRINDHNTSHDGGRTYVPIFPRKQHLRSVNVFEPVPMHLVRRHATGIDDKGLQMKDVGVTILPFLDISQKINKYTRAMGIINSVMKPSLVQKHTRIRLYNTLARSMLSYGSEAWTLRKADKSRITNCEMRFMRRTTGCTKWDLKRNFEILKKLKTQPVLDYIVQYQSNWKYHLEIMRQFMIMYHMAKDLWVVLLRDGVKILCETVTALVA